MIRWMFSLVLVSLLVSGPAVAQEEDSQPFARVEIGAKEVVVGKPVPVTVSLLVPTIFRGQAEFPDYDGINLIVKTTGPNLMPLTEYIGGRKWTGSSQTYWFYPMKPGDYAIEDARAIGTYSDPVDTTSVIADFRIEGFGFSAIVPAGAEDLSPLIVADTLTLQQSWEGPADSMGEGDAITRNLSARIEGSSALFLPALIPSSVSDLVKAYPEGQSVTDDGPGKNAGGTRTESVTYVARYGGEIEFPDIAIRWFNAKTGTVETAIAEGRSIVITAPDQPAKPVVSRKQIVALLVLLLCLLAILQAYRKWVHPVLIEAILKLRERWNTSEPYAARRVVLAIRAQDLDDVLRRLVVWLKRQDVVDVEGREAFVKSLMAVGEQRFGSGPEVDWATVERAFRQMRRESKARQAACDHEDLPDLNPF